VAKYRGEKIMTRKKEKTYTREYIENAVRLATASGNSAASAAMQLKIPVWKLRSWVREANQKLESSSDMEELLRLHNENKQLKEELEILKKAAAYFAKALH
jgi:transposase